MKQLIEAHHVGKTYTSEGTPTHALRDVSLSMREGEFVAIMGPSGSGKSTLLHILGFLDTPSRGEYYFQGKLSADYAPDEIARVRNQTMGFVFQSFNLLPRTSVLHNVSLPLLYSPIPRSEWRERAEKAIESVGLSHRIHHEPSELSGGEKQRAAIARALVLNPRVIFADEPTGNLDSQSGQTIMDIFQRLNEEKGHTIVLITHETYTAEHAERIIRIHDGVVADDAKTTVRRKARDHFEK